jgi:hypothetical protein
MIVSPSKGLFFLGTALMCSASLYAAELASPQNDPFTAMFNDPLTRIFVGEPNQLTLPPALPDDSELNPEQDDRCAPQIADHGLATGTIRAAASSEMGCQPDDKPAPGAIVLPGAVSPLAPQAEAKAEAGSVSATVQLH